MDKSNMNINELRQSKLDRNIEEEILKAKQQAAEAKAAAEALVAQAESR